MIRKEASVEKQELVRIFKALGNESRLAILDAILKSQRQCACCPGSPELPAVKEGALYCVDEIVGQFDMAQSTISQHLKELHRAGLLQRHKQAQWVYYTVNREALAELSEYLGALAAELTPAK